MSDERREVAERLREAALHPDVDGGVWVYDATAALGLEFDGYEGYFTAESVDLLADLIDPTCEMITGYTQGGKEQFKMCSCCGAAYAIGIIPRYCQRCGARVVGCHE